MLTGELISGSIRWHISHQITLPLGMWPKQAVREQSNQFGMANFKMFAIANLIRRY